MNVMQRICTIDNKVSITILIISLIPTDLKYG